MGVHGRGPHEISRTGWLCAGAGSTLGVGARSRAWAETSQEVREQVAAVQGELDELAEQIAEGEARVEELQGQVDELADESIELQTQIIRDRDRLAEIISTSYKENSDARILALILSSETMDELVSQVYYAQKVSDWQAECINQLNADKQELDERMAQLSAAKDEQAAELKELADKRTELDEKVATLNEKADRLEAEEAEAARKAAEEAARKAAEEQARREAEEKARQEALAAAAAAGDVEQATQTRADAVTAGLPALPRRTRSRTTTLPDQLRRPLAFRLTSPFPPLPCPCP